MSPGYGLFDVDFIRQTLHVRAFRCAIEQSGGDPLRTLEDPLTGYAR